MEGRVGVGDTLGVLRRRWWVIVLSLVVGICAAWAWTNSITPVYRAETRILIRQSPAQEEFSSGSDLRTRERDLKNEVEFALGDTVRNRVAELVPADASIDARALADSDTIVLTAEDADPELSTEYVSTYAQVYVEERARATIASFAQTTEVLRSQLDTVEAERDDVLAGLAVTPGDATLERRLADLDAEVTALTASLRRLELQGSLADAGVAQIVRAATVPADPVHPDVQSNLLLGAVGGLLIAALGVYLLEAMDDRIRTKSDLARVAEGVSVVGILPRPAVGRAGGGDKGRALVLGSTGAYVEAMRSLRSSVMFLDGRDAGLRSITVTSANPGEGKSTTAANLCIALARAGASCVLVDADLRSPRVHEICGLSIREGWGLADYFAEGKDLTIQEEAVSGRQLFSVVHAGAMLSEPAEVLSSRAFRSLIDELGSLFDFTIIDTPPVLAVSDGLVAAGATSGTLLVARSGKTDASDVVTALELLERAQATLVGTVLTGTSRGDGHGYGYGYGYGNRSSRRNRSAA